jgi:hypothetical protein
MAKLINLIPNNYTSVKVVSKAEMNEDLEDMDVALPSQVQRFLDRTISIVKGYNLPKKKEQLIIAKIIDALGMDRQQLMQAITKIKKNDILKK